MNLIKENDVYKRESKERFTHVETITFKIPECRVYEKAEYDWYIIVALEKSDLVKEDRHLLTGSLIIQYRNAIREAYNHELDSAIKNSYDYPRNRNTVKGIQDYIKRINDAQQKQMETM